MTRIPRWSLRHGLVVGPLVAALGLAGCATRTAVQGPGLGPGPDETRATEPTGPEPPVDPEPPTTPPARPPADRDGDRVADADDPCPDLAELMNGYEDDDGCPDDPPRLIIPDIDTVAIPKLHFAAAGARLEPTTFPLLDELAQLLRLHPEVLVVELQGHVDGKERGARLDVARAEAVRRALIDRGVEAERLTVKGYGTTRPLDPGKTTEARARNRRVELAIAARASDAVAPTP